MKRFLFIVFILSISTCAFAQNATLLQGIPIIAPPSGIPNPNYQGCPNCAPFDGLETTYRSSANGGLGGLEFNMPHIQGGPSSWPPVGASQPNAPLNGNNWNWLDDTPTHCTAPPLPPYCYFRTGLVAYPNGGVWNLRDGKITFAGASNVEYDIQVYIGTYVEPHTGFSIQPDMINGGPLQDHYQLVGGGGGPCPGPANVPCQIKFSAHLIHCPATGIQACEIRVSVYPKSTVNTNYILGVIGPDPVTHQGGVGQGYVSDFYLEQARGP